MLKSCPSCSYIGNDGEHVCPFCKADLAVGRPRRTHGIKRASCNALRSSGGSHTLPYGLSVCFRSSNSIVIDAAFRPNIHPFARVGFGPLLAIEQAQAF